MPRPSNYHKFSQDLKGRQEARAVGKELCVVNGNFPCPLEKRMDAKHQGEAMNWELQRMKQFLKIPRLGDPSSFVLQRENF